MPGWHVWYVYGTNCRITWHARPVDGSPQDTLHAETPDDLHFESAGGGPHAHEMPTDTAPRHSLRSRVVTTLWGLRLYLVCTPTGMPTLWALADPKPGEREVLAAMLEVDADLVARREGILLISGKGFASKAFERELAELGIELLRPSFKREKQRFGEPMLKKVRQLTESVNDALKGQLNLELHGGRTFGGVAIRVAQRVLAMAAGIWHNNKIGALVTRSLVACDH